MISIRYIFVVLVYKNTEDIRSFILSVRKTVRDYRIIIVNSFSDQETTNILAKISHEEDCDFIRCENNGYGYGNNIGIRCGSGCRTAPRRITEIRGFQKHRKR